MQLTSQPRPRKGDSINKSINQCYFVRKPESRPTKHFVGASHRPIQSSRHSVYESGTRISRTATTRFAYVQAWFKKTHACQRQRGRCTSHIIERKVNESEEDEAVDACTPVSTTRGHRTVVIITSIFDTNSQTANAKIVKSINARTQAIEFGSIDHYADECVHHGRRQRDVNLHSTFNHPKIWILLTRTISLTTYLEIKVHNR
jgi:hypothetical protein